MGREGDGEDGWGCQWQEEAYVAEVCAGGLTLRSNPHGNLPKMQCCSQDSAQDRQPAESKGGLFLTPVIAEADIYSNVLKNQ